MLIETETIQWPRALFVDLEPRAEGLHLSDIIRRIMEDTGMAPSGGFTDLQLAAEIGLLWEDVLSLAMGNKYPVRPPQICEDGIWMSLDGIGDDPLGKADYAVHEYKAAWASSAKDIGANFKYMTQVKAYCRSVGTQVAVMHVFHVMGDYRGSGPLYQRSRIAFTAQELWENWQMVLRFKEKM